MNELDPIAPIAAQSSAPLAQLTPALPAPASAMSAGAPLASTSLAPGTSFQDMLAGAAHTLEARIEHADALVRQFVVDDSVPIHEVTVALEEARIAVELALQVRTRVVEAYRDIVNMQL